MIRPDRIEEISTGGRIRMATTSDPVPQSERDLFGQQVLRAQAGGWWEPFRKMVADACGLLMPQPAPILRDAPRREHGEDAD